MHTQAELMICGSFKKKIWSVGLGGYGGVEEGKRGGYDLISSYGCTKSSKTKKTS